MIPNNVLSTEVIRAPYVRPYNTSSSDFERFEFGGVAIQDTSAGLRYQTWFGEWHEDTGQAILTPLTTKAPVTIFTETAVEEFLFTFDQNMRWVAATQKTGNVYNLRWYDTVVEAYVVTPFSNIVSAFLRLDDNRDIEVLQGKADVIFAYITANGRLCFRMQRERFATEHVLSATLPPKHWNLRISHMGLTKKLRLQWRLVYRIKSGD